MNTRKQVLLSRRDSIIKNRGEDLYKKLLHNAMLNDDADKIVEIYKKDRLSDGTPENTAKKIIKALGKKRAKEVITALVIAKGDWDQRIFPENRNWAKNNSNMNSEEINKKYDFFYRDEIHPAHMNQIAQEFIKIEKQGAVRTPKTTKLPTNSQLNQRAFR